ncbi:hypothetical protein [Pseudomonas muyukensis]|nr:hypothetical protein [Pseudomonas muyukensis]
MPANTGMAGASLRGAWFASKAGAYSGCAWQVAVGLALRTG